MAVYSVSLPADLVTKVHRIAEQRGVSPEEAIRYLIREGLKTKGGK